MDIPTYLTRLNQSSSDIIHTAESLTFNQLTEKPESTWSIMDTLEHIWLSDKIVFSVIQKPSATISESDEHFGASKMAHVMVGKRTNHKVRAPEILIPNGRFKTFPEFREKFLKQRNELAEALQGGRIVLDNRVHPHPFLGELTIRDWLYFLIQHGERHLAQIREKLENN